MPDTDSPNRPSAWVTRCAWLLCLLTFPLLWVGGLVTSTDAGMAVPDWPTTYGYNMFSYPWQTWLFGPWDLFIEHGHRLLASLVGLVTIALVLLTWKKDPRRWLLTLTVVALGLVILQGVLGGVRVVENERLVAMVHGCVGPLFFALTVLLAVATTRAWKGPPPGATNRRTAGWLLATGVLAYVQLTLGAQLRHMPETASPWAFAELVKLHLLTAGLVAISGFAAAWSARKRDDPMPVKRLTGLLAAVVVVQLSLGGGTWLLKYGCPGWARELVPATMDAVIADGMLQTQVVTAHSAIGSLIIGLAVAATAYALRHAAPVSSPNSISPPAGGEQAV